MDEYKFAKSVFITIIVIVISMVFYFTLISPFINVWHQEMIGKAEFARAESNRKIVTLEAIAKKESSEALAQAEVIRADGVAKANKIIGDSLTGNEGYLRYLWIQGLQTNEMSVVYIPTEANLPIMEAGRWREMEKSKNN